MSSELLERLLECFRPHHHHREHHGRPLDRSPPPSQLHGGPSVWSYLFIYLIKVRCNLCGPGFVVNNMLVVIIFVVNYFTSFSAIFNNII